MVPVNLESVCSCSDVLLTNFLFVLLLRGLPAFRPLTGVTGTRVLRSDCTHRSLESIFIRSPVICDSVVKALAELRDLRTRFSAVAPLVVLSLRSLDFCLLLGVFKMDFGLTGVFLSGVSAAVGVDLVRFGCFLVGVTLTKSSSGLD